MYDLIDIFDEEFNSRNDEAVYGKSSSVNLDLWEENTSEPDVASEEESRELSTSATGVADFSNSEIPDGPHAVVVECPHCHCRLYTRWGQRLLRRHLADDKCELHLIGIPSITFSTPPPSPSTATGSTLFSLPLDYEASTMCESMTSTFSDISTILDEASSILNAGTEEMALDNYALIEIPNFDSLDYDLMLNDF